MHFSSKYPVGQKPRVFSSFPKGVEPVKPQSAFMLVGGDGQMLGDEEIALGRL